jgi:hypothetical protein
MYIKEIKTLKLTITISAKIEPNNGLVSHLASQP